MALTDNPMSLTITGNTTIGAELEVSTPKLYSNWTEYNYGEGEEYLLYNANNNKCWIDYTIGNLDVDTDYTELNFKLEWSPTINQHAVEVTDY